MHIQHLHEWNVTPAKAVIYDHPLNLEAIRLVAGVDVSVKNDISQAAIVVLSFPELEPVETVLAKMPTPFPYIPGLLSFREGPVLEEAFKLLVNEPDVLIFDGMGRIHPRRIGIATHMGLWLERPTIGCGKTHFVGKHGVLNNHRGATQPLTDKGEVIGKIVRTREGVKPVYISVGHLTELDSAVDIILACTPKYRLPQPIRMAHNAAGTLEA